MSEEKKKRIPPCFPPDKYEVKPKQVYGSGEMKPKYKDPAEYDGGIDRDE